MGAGKMMDAAGRDEPGVGEGNAIAFLGALGLSETAEAEYLKRLADGTLVAVQIHDQKMAAIARKIFEEAHAQEISEV